MTQKKLDTFFSVKIEHHPQHKRTFIYDPYERRAFFTTYPQDADVFVVKKLSVNLYIRSRLPSDNFAHTLPLLSVDNISIPLLKSNLQKAIRRKHTDIAVSSALALIQNDPIQFIRRLAIIFIEDVAILDSYPIVIWLMMADMEYVWTKQDIDTLLYIVKNLSIIDSTVLYETNKTIGNENNTGTNPTHEMFEHRYNSDILLSIYYRIKYGGLKGDIRMLTDALFSELCVLHTDYSSDLVIPSELEILSESIDFHPFPKMLYILERKTGIPRDDIKNLIWNVESGLNVRKKDTVLKSVHYEQTQEWKEISKYIDEVRLHIISS